MATRATMSALPPELFENVARHLPKPSLLSLRSASRECNTKAHYIFSAHFAKLQVLPLYQPSMESAIGIAHEEQCGKGVRTLVIDVRSMVRPVYYYIAKGDRLIGRNSSHELSDDTMHPKTAALLQRYQEISSLTERYFTVLLTLLKQYGKLQKIQIVDYDTGTRPCGTKKIWADDLLDWDHMNTMSIIKDLLLAMATSQTVLELFSIQCEGWVIPANFVAEDASFINAATDAFKNVKTLDLSFWNELSLCDGRPFSIDDAQCLLGILPTTLEKLDIRIYNPCNHYDSANCVNRCFRSERKLILESLFSHTFPRLRRLSIYGGEICPRALRDFFSKHEMLERLTFEGAKIIGMDFRVDNGDLGVESLWRDLEGAGIYVEDSEGGTVSGHVKN